ncbi:Delta-sterol C-methyltransferase [Mycena kentingensis (nom. inval.)]|nr:Delta-sterol C-methyltransferase [Mycena kentingensis (nom. inval.)]
MSSGGLPFVELPAPSGSPSAALIFLHGSGGCPDDYPREVAAAIRATPSLAHVKCILPAAPRRVVQANMGMRMPAWFDIFTFDFPLEVPPAGNEDAEGIEASIAALEGILEDVVASGIPAERIVLGGISQGAAMALLTGLTTPKKLAGLVALSSRLPLRYKLKSMASPHCSKLPIFWGHGQVDPLVPHELGRVCAEFIVQELGVPSAPYLGAPEGLDFHSYPKLPHTICEEEVRDVARWLAQVIPAD